MSQKGTKRPEEFAPVYARPGDKKRQWAVRSDGAVFSRELFAGSVKRKWCATDGDLPKSVVQLTTVARLPAAVRISWDTKITVNRVRVLGVVCVKLRTPDGTYHIDCHSALSLAEKLLRAGK